MSGQLWSYCRFKVSDLGDGQTPALVLECVPQMAYVLTNELIKYNMGM